MRLSDALSKSRCPHWVPIDAAADAHGRSLASMNRGFVEDVPEDLLDDPPPPPLARAPPCSICGCTDIATVPLAESMLECIWEVPKLILGANREPMGTV